MVRLLHRLYRVDAPDKRRPIEVTTLTFQDHVTSSITWPFDSPYAISISCQQWQTV